MLPVHLTHTAGGTATAFAVCLCFDPCLPQQARYGIFHLCIHVDVQNILDFGRVWISDFQIRDAQPVGPLEKHLKTVDRHWDRHMVTSPEPGSEHRCFHAQSQKGNQEAMKCG